MHQVGRVRAGFVHVQPDAIRLQVIIRAAAAFRRKTDGAIRQLKLPPHETEIARWAVADAHHCAVRHLRDLGRSGGTRRRAVLQAEAIRRNHAGCAAARQTRRNESIARVLRVKRSGSHRRDQRDQCEQEYRPYKSAS